MSSYDPFPTTASNGPDFIDTGACHCALRQAATDSGAAWRCLGNRTADIYEGYSGKWFQPRNSGQQIVVADYSHNNDQYPPNNHTASIAYDSDDANDDPALQLLSTVERNPLSMFDNACTGVNNTVLSEHYYESQKQLDAGQQPTAAVTCLSGSASPVTIQNATTFNKQGCYAGFFCPNNSVNALPEYCTPLEACQASRLAGIDCPVAMGAFEPLLCPAGYYCPKGGKEMLTCPVGNYCMPGAVEPTPCQTGSHCPAGSIREMNYLAVTVIAVIDVIVIVIELSYLLKKRVSRARKARGMGKKDSKIRRAKTLRELSEWRTGYTSLPSLPDLPNYAESEAWEVDPPIRPFHRVPTGFQAAVDAEYLSKFDSNETNDALRLRTFIESCSRCNEGAQLGLSFSFTDLKFHPRGVTKPVLSAVTGSIAHGSLVGVMGGSGAGKTSFVNVLMGKVSHTGGTVVVNGDGGKVSKYKKTIGYVPQDDILLHELTVRENILHSARIRLPSNWTDNEVQRHVDALIDCLELDHVKNSIVGSPTKPVISGGQRKRVSIGMELASAPKALFLDEPTSGLDATAAASIMRILKALSQIGITIVTIIHQPRQEIFTMIDDVIFLADGQVVFQGKGTSVRPYFERAGFQFPHEFNIADVVMDIITGQGRPYKPSGDISKDSLIRHWRDCSASYFIPASPPLIPQAERAAFNKSIRRRGARWYRQLYLCFARSVLQQYRTQSSFWFEIGAATLGGFLCGLAQNSKDGVMFHGLYLEDYAYLSPAIDFSTTLIMALLSGLSIGLVASSPGVKIFGEEKLLYFREAAVGHSRSAYYLGKTLASLPRLVLGTLHFTVLFVLLSTPSMPWATIFAANLLYYYCIYGLATTVSMITRREDGPLIATMFSLVVGILSGMAPRLSQVEQWHLGWLWQCSPGVWLTETYFTGCVQPMAYLYQTESAAQQLGFVLGRTGLDLGMLAIIGTVYRVVAGILMVVVKRNKQR